ncbi:MAG: fibronectin type III domain-containing protein [Vicinamibacterales bacterium]
MNVRNLSTAAVALVFALLAPPVFAASLTIAWNPAEESVAGYIVKYGTRPGEYAAQVNVGKATTFKAEDLVVGQTYYFTVQAYAADGSTGAPATELPAVVIGASRGVASRLLSPQRGAEDVTSAQIFSWEQVAKAEAYDFSIGTEPGGRDVVDSGETKRTWWVADSLPAGAQLFARLRTRVGDRWTATDLSFESAPTARLIYPFDGADDISASEQFVWSAVTGAQGYRLLVGTTPGGRDLADTGATAATSFTLRNLQPGQTLYASVATRLGDVWTTDAVTFTTSTSARFTHPMAGDGSDLGGGLGWTSILGATAYRVRLGTSPDGDDLLDSGETLQTTISTPVLPAGQPVYARIATSYAGEWSERATTLSLAGAALVAPTDSSVVSTNHVFTWTSISNAEAYLLTVGTTPGAKDVLTSGEVQSPGFEAAALPAGRLYVTVWTKANGLWNGTSTTVLVR